MIILNNRTLGHTCLLVIIFTLFLTSVFSVCSAEDLAVTLNNSGNDYIQIKSTRHLELSSFKVNNPYRLVIDLKNTTINPLDFEKKHPQIKNILVNQSANSTRISIEPLPDVQLYVRQDSNNEVTIFGSRALADTSTSRQPSSVLKSNTAQHAPAENDSKIQPAATGLVRADSLVIKDGLLTIGTNGFIDNVTTLSMPESNRFVFILANTLLTFKQGRYKINFHNLTGMDAEQQGSNARLTFHVKPNTTVPNYFSSKESDSLQIRFFVTEDEREPQQQATTQAKKMGFDSDKSATAKYKGPRISLDFDNADLRHIFRMLAEVNKKNYVLSDSIKGSMSLKLMNVPWQQAQELILRAHNLIVVEEGNVSEVITVAQKAERIKRQLEFDDFSKSQEQVGICAVQLRHAASAKVATAASTILTRGAKEFSRESAAKVQAQGQGTENTTANVDGARTDSNVDMNRKRDDKTTVYSINNIYAEPNTNRLIIRDYPSKFPEILKVLSLLDVPDQQVMIEARIIEASTDFQRSLGVQWGIHYRDGSASFLGINSLDTGFGGITNEPPQSGSFGPGMATGISFGTLTSNINLDLKFSAAAGAGMIKIVSTPKVAVAYGEKATIKDGKKQPYQTTSQNGTQTEFVEAVLSLEVTPTITPSCDVVMDLKITNDSVGTATGDATPPINKKSAETKLTVRSGETAVIGGTYVNSETETDDGVPYLMDIPFLGKLFKSRTSTKNNRELLVFITPKLLNSSCKDSGVMNLKYEKLECTAF